MNPRRKNILLLFGLVACIYVGYWLLVTAKEVFAWENVNILGKLIGLIWNTAVVVFYHTIYDPIAIVFIVGMAIWFFRAKAEKPS